MKNLADEIPRRAFINAQIIQQAHDSPAFQLAAHEVSERYGIADYQFLNPAYVAALLYCLLVVPRQLFVEGCESFWDSQVPVATIRSYFTIRIVSPKDLTASSHFLRRLRNAMAHARFEVDESFVFVFRDGPNRNTIEFEVQIAADKLMAFLSEIGSQLANLGTSPSLVQ
jgi:hypothetical protein